MLTSWTALGAFIACMGLHIKGIAQLPVFQTVLFRPKTVRIRQEQSETEVLFINLNNQDRSNTYITQRIYKTNVLLQNTVLILHILLLCMLLALACISQVPLGDGFCFYLFLCLFLALFVSCCVIGPFFLCLKYLSITTANGSLHQNSKERWNDLCMF